MAELTRPFPPGTYPVIVIGSGPGGLQVSYSLRRLGVPHAVLSADSAPGGMFRRWPFFQRLLSWTKPHAPAERGSRAYERYDWNSLLGEEPETRAIAATLMDGTSYFPSRPEMEANLATFAERAGLDVRYDCEWRATRPLDPAGTDGARFELETGDGLYRCTRLILAVGVAEPYTPAGQGMEHAYHYADVRPAETYAGRRVCIIGKQNSGFELATGLLPWAQQLVLVSPSPTKLSVSTRSLVGVRARYVQPYEDHVLGGGVSILDAAIDRLDRATDGTVAVHLRRTDGGGDVALAVDDVISATGFVAPLRDLPSLGLTTYGASNLPAVDPWWESVTLPGVFAAGTLGQAAKGLRRNGIPANSGAVHGARYNARVLAEYIARTGFGVEPGRPRIAPEAAVSFVAGELAEAPDLFHQRGYLARVLSADPAGGWRDDGVQPLAHVLDSSGPDLVAFTLDSDGSGAIYPILFARHGGTTTEHVVDPDPLGRYDTDATRRIIVEALRAVDRTVPAA
jgi:thioredoxin reductase